MSLKTNCDTNELPKHYNNILMSKFDFLIALANKQSTMECDHIKNKFHSKINEWQLDRRAGALE